MGDAGNKTRVKTKADSSNSNSGYEEGISPKATKWRTGSPVTEAKRKEFPHKDYKTTGDKDMTDNITEQEITTAINTLNKLDASGVGFSLILTDKYIPSFNGSSHYSTNNIRGRVKKLVKLRNVTPRKAKLQESLDDLLRKAEEIKKQIEEI